MLLESLPEFTITPDECRPWPEPPCCSDLYRGNIGVILGIMEKKMETIIVYCGNNGKENGNYYSIFGLYWENGKEHGNYYKGYIGVILGLACCDVMGKA